MKKVLINAEERELRVAILEDDQLVELYIESLDDKSILNNIYKGRIEGIIPGLKAAFVNIGLERNAFLHFDDVRPDLLLAKAGLPYKEATPASEAPAQDERDEAADGVSDAVAAAGELAAMGEAHDGEDQESGERKRRRRRRGRRGGRRRREAGASAEETDLQEAGAAEELGEDEDEAGEEAGEPESAPVQPSSQQPSRRERRRERRRDRGRAWNDQQAQPGNAAQAWMPSPGGAAGTREAFNPYHDIFSPYAQPQPQGRKRWRKDQFQGEDRFNRAIAARTGGRVRDSQEDFFPPPPRPRPEPAYDDEDELQPAHLRATAPGQMPYDYDDEDDGPQPGNEKYPTQSSGHGRQGGKRRRRRGGRSRSMKKPGGNSYYAVRRKKSEETESAEETPAPKKTTRSRKAAAAADEKPEVTATATKTKRTTKAKAASTAKSADTEKATTKSTTRTTSKTAAKSASKSAAKSKASQAETPAPPAEEARPKRTTRRKAAAAEPPAPVEEAAPAAETAAAKPASRSRKKTAKAAEDAGDLLTPDLLAPIEKAEAAPAPAAEEALAKKPSSRRKKAEAAPAVVEAPPAPAPAEEPAAETEAAPARPRGRGRTRKTAAAAVAEAPAETVTEAPVQQAPQEPVAEAPAAPAAEAPAAEAVTPAEAAEGTEASAAPAEGPRGRRRRRGGRDRGGREQVQPEAAASSAPAAVAPEVAEPGQTLAQPAVAEAPAQPAVEAPAVPAVPHVRHDRERQPRERDRDRRPERRRIPQFTEVFKKGDELMVQVIKEEIGMKGARISTYVSLPGRYLVMLPYPNEEGGVSRKVEDLNERKRLKRILRDISASDDHAFIIRTAGIDRDEEEIAGDVEFLRSEWKNIEARYEKAKPGEIVYDDHNILYRLARDVFDDNIGEILVDSPQVADQLRDILSKLIPDLMDRVQVYDEPENIFHRFQVEKQIIKAARRKVWLKSGGYIIIDEAEALTAIDVNSGKFIGKDDQEKMILKTNLEAARTIARELKLRDIGGLIVIDFIDMKDQRNRDQLLAEFRQHLKKDRSKTAVSSVSEFGLVEMTRKRVRRSLRKTLFMDCPYCQGAGVILNEQQIWLHIKHEIIRLLEAGQPYPPSLNIIMNPRIRTYIDQNYRETLQRLEQKYDVQIRLAISDVFHMENYSIEKLPRELPVADAHASYRRDGGAPA